MKRVFFGWGGFAVAAAVLVVIHTSRAASLEVAPLRQQGPHSYSVSFDALPGSYYDVETSTNLLSWTVLRTLRADSTSATWDDTNAFPSARFYRVADWSGQIVVAGNVRTADGQGLPASCPFCDILVTSSLDASIAYTDSQGQYVLRTRATAAPTNVPFTLSFSKLGFRAHSTVVTNPSMERLDILSLAGPSNNDFSNRLVFSGSVTNQGDNALADTEENEPGVEPSVWYSFTAPADGTLRFAIDTTEFLPAVSLFKGGSLETLEPLDRGTVSNWVEWRIEVTRDFTVYAGEQIHMRVGTIEHPTRGVSGGPFDWKSTFEPGFPLVFGAWDTNHGIVAVDPATPNGRYEPGAQVMLTAVPAPNYVFTGWQGSTGSAQTALAVFMDEAKTIWPTFQLANGNYTNATLLTGEVATAEAWVPLDGSVWFEWTAPRNMPIAVAWDTTNFLHGTVYRVEGPNLSYVAQNHGYQAAADHKDTRFHATAGTTYKIAVHFEANERGLFRLTLYEPIVIRGALSGRPYRYTIFVNAPFTNQSFSFVFYSGFELWTRVMSTPEQFPYSVSLTALYYRPTSGVVYSNAQEPVYSLTLAGPANNDLSNATPVTASEGTIWATFSSADTEPGEPGLGRSVWYAFQPPGNGTYFITNTIALEISGWEGTAVAALQPVTGFVHQRTATKTTTEWTAKAGQTLYIRAGASGSLPATPGTLPLQYTFVPDYPLYASTAQPLAGQIAASPPSTNQRYPAGTSVTLNATLEPHYVFEGWTGHVQSAQNPITFTISDITAVQGRWSPSNDLFATAEVISGLPVMATGANRYATAEPGEPNQGPWPAASSVWYRWTAPSGGAMEIEFDFTDVTIVSTVFKGGTFETLTPVANNLAGRNIRRIAFTATAGQTYAISVDAYESDGGPFAFTIRNVDEPRYILNVAPARGGYAQRSPAADGNGEYAAGTVVTIGAVPSNASTFSRWEELTWGTPVPLGSNSTLLVTMDRHRIIRPVFDLGVQRLNDDLGDSYTFIADGIAALSTNVTASSEPGEPALAANGSGKSLWWLWTPATLQPMAFTTFGSSFTNVVAVYRGAVVSGLELVAVGEPGLASSVSFVGEAGVPYHVAVDGIGGATGVVRLTAAENEQFFAEFTYLTNGQSWAVPSVVPILAQAVNSELSVTQINLFTNGTLALSRAGGQLETGLSNLAPGIVVFSMTALDERGRTAAAGPVTNFIHAYRFATNVITARKSDGVASLRILRSPPHGVRSEVFLSVEPGSAVPGTHYTPLCGSVLFYPGETERPVHVPVLQSPNVPSTWWFTPQLASGDGLPAIDSVTVTISNELPMQVGVLLDDSFPQGATSFGSFEWISTNPAPMSGSLARRASGQHGYTIPVGATRYFQDRVFWQDIYVDPQNPPAVIGIQLPYTYGTITVYWGDRAAIEPWRHWLGPLPDRGAWRQLAVPKGLFQTTWLTSMTWFTEGGTATWDRSGTW